MSGNNTIMDKAQNFTVRFAEENDVKIILKFITDLAEYENLLELVVATEEILYDSLFKKKSAEVLIGEYKGEPVGFALFFHNFSTFLGQAGLYLEDLYIRPDMRGKGLGKIMFAHIGKVAIERKCGRLEWSCLDWNEPSIQFYKKLGAVAMNDWTGYRMSGEQIENLAKEELI